MDDAIERLLASVKSGSGGGSDDGGSSSDAAPQQRRRRQQQQPDADDAGDAAKAQPLVPGAILAPRQRGGPSAARDAGRDAHSGINGSGGDSDRLLRSPSGTRRRSSSSNNGSGSDDDGGSGSNGNGSGSSGGRQRRAAPPVLKGDLELPGGPQWSALRRHTFAAAGDPALPSVRAVVIVEGDQDRRAVAKAVNAAVYVCGGTRVLRAHAARELDAIARLGRPLVVLTDPDERGRELRAHIDAALSRALEAQGLPRSRLLHAFVPEASALAAVDGPVHAAGNRGIEHAVPGVLLAALRAAAPSHPPGRGAWDLPRLQALRLARPFDGGKDAQREHREGGGVAGGSGGGGESGSSGTSTPLVDEPRERRRRLCALLGLGKCSGAQLAAALNKYFDEARFEAALAAVDARAPALK